MTYSNTNGKPRRDFTAQFWDGKRTVKRTLRAVHQGQAEIIANSIALANGWTKKQVEAA